MLSRCLPRPLLPLIDQLPLPQCQLPPPLPHDHRRCHHRLHHRSPAASSSPVVGLPAPYCLSAPGAYRLYLLVWCRVVPAPLCPRLLCHHLNLCLLTSLFRRPQEGGRSGQYPKKRWAPFGDQALSRHAHILHLLFALLRIDFPLMIIKICPSHPSPLNTLQPSGWPTDPQASVPVRLCGSRPQREPREPRGSRVGESSIHLLCGRVATVRRVATRLRLIPMPRHVSPLISLSLRPTQPRVLWTGICCLSSSWARVWP